MTHLKKFENPNERVVKVVEVVNIGNGKKQERVFWPIRDIELDYWRGVAPLDEYAAWTRTTDRRAEFPSPSAAKEALKGIWRWRQEWTTNSPLVDLAEDLAA